MTRALFPATSAEDGRPDERQKRLLDAALVTFLRYGFRKTSMEEVARAAHVSRQALYLHFATKEDLFRAAVRHFLETGLEAAAGSLDDASAPLEKRLAGAFDAWVGRYVGLASGDVADLQEASNLLVGPLVAEYEARFREMVTKAVRASALPAAYKAVGLNAQKLADTLHAAARGLKQQCTSRAEFGERFGFTLRALCMPLAEKKR